MTIDTELKNLYLRISEFNLRANNYFDKGIFGHDPGVRRQLEIMREQIITFGMSKYPKLKISDALRQLSKFDIKGNIIRNMTSDLDEIIKIVEREDEDEDDENN